jgi:hypothetical protein
MAWRESVMASRKWRHGVENKRKLGGNGLRRNRWHRALTARKRQWHRTGG